MRDEKQGLKKSLSLDFIVLCFNEKVRGEKL
jgi:hypothetical protein